jgi:hypothetical protein
MANAPGPNHYKTILRALKDGRLVPFLGAGVNLCDRPPGAAWEHGVHLPNGGELSQHLADHFNYQPAAGAEQCPACRAHLQLAGEKEKQDLIRVSQYVALDVGPGPLYEELHDIFNADYPPTSLHKFLAAVPGELRARNLPKTTIAFRRRFVVITTNYDDVLERAFDAAGEPYHVVSYLADRAEPEERGKCIHWPAQAGGKPVVVNSPNDYQGLMGDEHAVIVKIHGAVDRSGGDYDSFVITEDHYIDYLTRTKIEMVLPHPLPAILKVSHFLFLGYSLRDLNLRVILRLISRERHLNYNSWAIQLRPQSIDEKFWRERNVEIFDSELKSYVAALKAALDAEPLPGGAP